MLTTDCFISKLVSLIFVFSVNERIPLRLLDCVKINSAGRRLMPSDKIQGAKYSCNWSTLNEQNDSLENMMYIHAYGVYSRIWWMCNFWSLFNTKAKESLWSSIFQLVREMIKKVVLKSWGEKRDIRSWIQKWWNLENITIKSTYFVTLQHTTIIYLVI